MRWSPPTWIYATTTASSRGHPPQRRELDTADPGRPPPPTGASWRGRSRRSSRQPVDGRSSWASAGRHTLVAVDDVPDLLEAPDGDASAALLADLGPGGPRPARAASPRRRGRGAQGRPGRGRVGATRPHRGAARRRCRAARRAAARDVAQPLGPPCGGRAGAAGCWAPDRRVGCRSPWGDRVAGSGRVIAAGQAAGSAAGSPERVEEREVVGRH